MDFMGSVGPMVRTEAISKVREHYDEAKRYGFEPNRKTLPLVVDYKMLEMFFNTN